MALPAPRKFSPVQWVPNMDMASPYQTFDLSQWSQPADSRFTPIDFGSLNQQIGDAATSGFPALSYSTNTPVVPPGVTSGNNQPFFPGTEQQSAGFNFGWNAPSFQFGIQGLSTLGNLYQGFQANKIAKQQLAWAKEFGNANLNNSIKSYNTAIEGRANARQSSMGWTPEQIAAYTDKNKLTR